MLSMISCLLDERESFGPRMCLIVDLQHMLGRKLRIALGGGEALVAQEFLNRAQIGAFFQHVRAECVAQSVRMDVRRQAF